MIFRLRLVSKKANPDRKCLSVFAVYVVTSKKGFCTKRNAPDPPDLDCMRFLSMFMLFFAQCNKACQYKKEREPYFQA